MPPVYIYASERTHRVASDFSSRSCSSSGSSRPLSLRCMPRRLSTRVTLHRSRSKLPCKAEGGRELVFQIQILKDPRSRKDPLDSYIKTRCIIAHWTSGCLIDSRGRTYLSASKPASSAQLRDAARHRSCPLEIRVNKDRTLSVSGDSSFCSCSDKRKEARNSLPLRSMLLRLRLTSGTNMKPTFRSCDASGMGCGLLLSGSHREGPRDHHTKVWTLCSHCVNV